MKLFVSGRFYKRFNRERKMLNVKSKIKWNILLRAFIVRDGVENNVIFI